MSIFFSDTSYPVITAIMGHSHTDDFIADMKTCLSQGAEAFCLCVQGIVPEEKTPENLKRIIDAADNHDIYIANYVRGNSQPELRDETLASQLIEMARCGAKLIDVRADMFCRDEHEITTDSSAIRKQEYFISQIHQTGAKALMSTHIFEYRTPQNILDIALKHQQRGADIAKIVTFVNSQKEADDAFATTMLLKEKLSIPFLFLCNGPFCKKHRLLGPSLGSCMYLCVENSKKSLTQPTIAEVQNIIKTIKITEENYEYIP